MSESDFYVKFDSNAVAWAKQLETQLKPARDQVASMTAMLENLDKRASTSGGKLQQALAKTVPDPTGNGVDNRGAGNNQLVSQINQASDELAHMMGQISTAVQGLRQLPEVIGNTMRGVRATLSNLEQQAGGQGRYIQPTESNRFVKSGTPGAVQLGSQLGSVYSEVTRAVKAGQVSLSGGAIAAPRLSNIGSVSSSAIDRAGADRIVRAIEAQTQVLQERLTGGRNRVSGKAGKGAGADTSGQASGTTEAEQGEKSFAERMKNIDQQIGLIMNHVGEGADATTKGLLNTLKAQRASIEREATGMTQSQQKAARKAESQAKQQAADQLQLINTAGSPDFLSQVGRGTGKIGMPQLKQMADAFTGVGIPVQYSTRTKQTDLAQQLQAAHGTYSQQYTDTVPDSLKAGLGKAGQSIKVDTITENVQKLLGDIERNLDTAIERAAARELLKANALSGGRGPGDEILPSTSTTKRSKLGGQPTYGAGVFPVEGTSPLSRVGTPDEVDAARKLLKQVTDESALARKNSTRADFNPYDPALSGGIKGTGNQAEAARISLKGLRDATTELDQLSKDYETLQKAVQESTSFIERATARAGTSGQKPTDVENLASARTRVTENQAALAPMRKMQELFENPNFLAGRDMREGARSDYNDRVTSLQSRGGNIQDAALIRDATAQSVTGIRTALQSRQLTRNIPGLTTTGRGSTLKYTGTDGLSREDQKSLDQATNQLSSAQRKTFTARSGGGTPEEIAKAEAKLENSAAHFAETIARIFNGIAPSIRSLTGQDPVNPKNIPAEERRQDPINAATSARADRSISAAVAQANKVVGAGGGSGAGGTGKTTSASSDGPDRALLAKILAKLTEIHGTLKAGIPVTPKEGTGVAGVSAAARRTSAPLAELKGAASDNPDEQQVAIDAQRARETALRASDVDRAHGQANATVTRASTQSQVALREEYRATQQLAQAMSHLSDATKIEVAELTRLNSIGGEQARTAEHQAQIAQQQVRVYSGVANDLHGAGASAAERSASAKTILSQAGPSVSTPEVQDIARTARSQSGFKGAGEGMGNDLTAGIESKASALFGEKGFFGRAISSTGTFMVRNFTAGLVFGVTNALQSATSEAIKAEATFIRVSATLQATGKDVGNLRGDLQNISSDYGVALNDVYDTAAGLAGLFDNAKDLAAGTRVVAQLQTISDGALSAKEALGVLSSTLSAFEKSSTDPKGAKNLVGGVEGVQHVADVLTTIQNTLNVNVEDSAEGVARLAGLAKSMKLSFEETAVFAAQIAKQTNQSGAAAGEQFSRIIGGLQTGRGQSAVTEAYNKIQSPQNYGAQLQGALDQGDFGQVFKVMIEGWDKLTDAQRRSITVAVAGQKQAAAFTALMNGGTKELNVLSEAEQAHGTAAERMTKIMNTLNRQMAVLRSNFQNLAKGLIDTGLLNALGLILKATNDTLEVLNSMLGKFNQIADDNPLLKFLRDATTLLVGFAVVAKLAGAGVAGIKGVLPKKPIETAALEEGATLSSSGARVAAVSSGRIARPPYSAYGGLAGGLAGGRAAGQVQGNYLARGVGYGLDRTVGVGLEGAQRGISTAATKLQESAGTFRQGVGNFVSKIGSVAGIGAQSARAGFQHLGTTGGVSGFLSNRATGLQSRAEDYAAQAAQSRSVFEDQVRHASYEGPAAGANRTNFAGRLTASGMAPEEVALRTATPNTGLIKQAEQSERLSRVATTASGATGKLAGSLESLSSSGVLADAAMAALIVGIVASTKESARQKQAGQTFDSEYDQKYGPDAGKTSAQKAADYISPAQADYQKGLKDFKDSSLFSKGLVGAGAAINSPSGLLKAFTGNFSGIRESQNRALGLNNRGTETQDTTLGTALLTKAQSDLDKQSKDHTGTLDSYAGVQKTLAKKIKDEVAKINADGSLSKTQKEAALANLDTVSHIIEGRVNDLSAVLLGLKSKQVLTAEQIANVDTASAAYASTGGNTGLGGVDLSKTFNVLKENTGAQKGSVTSNVLNRLKSGTEDSATAGLDNIKLVRNQVTQLQQDLLSKLNQGADSSETDPIQAQLLTKIAQLRSSETDAAQAITAYAALIGGAAHSSGNYGRALSAYGNALRQQESIYNSDRRSFLAANRAVDAAASTVTQIMEITGQGQNSPAMARLNMMLNGGPKKMTPKQKEILAQDNANSIANFQSEVSEAVAQATRNITLKISKDKTDAERTADEAIKDSITAGLLGNLYKGKAAGGISAKDAKKYGQQGVGIDQLTQSQADANTSELAEVQDQKDRATTARQDAAALTQAYLGTKQAFDDAHGYAVQSARVQVAMARAGIAAAKADLAAATTADERSQAQAAIYGAEAQLLAASAAVQQSQADFVKSQYDVSIALATASGKTVLAATRTLAQARAALGAARKQSGGKVTAEVNAARVQVIQSEAAQRDAVLQDKLDTIDFNLQMGRITQVSAVHALQQILKTSDLTKAQRQQLLLQIKGMQDSMADSQWNFADIKLPTPYEMRRYITQKKQQLTNSLDSAASSVAAASNTGIGPYMQTTATANSGATHATTITNNFKVNGADVGAVKKIIKEVVGGNVNTKTTAARRGR